MGSQVQGHPEAAPGRCELCGRRVRHLTRHHLVPRSRSRKRKRKKREDRRRAQQDLERTVALCLPCHKNVHRSIDHKELERGYRTVEALSSHPAIQRFTDWIRNKPHGRA